MTAADGAGCEPWPSLTSGRRCGSAPATVSATGLISVLVLVAAAPGIAHGSVFADGFESGDASQWSQSAGGVVPCPADGRSRYPHLDSVAPVNDCVAERMLEIAAADGSRADDVFLKTGSSETVSASSLQCFSDESYDIVLDGRTYLQPAIDFFASGDAAGATPFERVSEAASPGWPALRALQGGVLQEEIDEINPRVGVVDFGLNDIVWLQDYRQSLLFFYDNLQGVLDVLEDDGVIPLIIGLGPRADSMATALWVSTFDVVTRAMAEERQLPYLSLLHTMSTLPAMGLLADGVHGNVYRPGGFVEPCVFAPVALDYHHNVRNLRTIELLRQVKRIVVGSGAGAGSLESWQGAGSAEAPIVIDTLPFSHHGDTTVSPFDEVDSYPCHSGDYDAPELWYRLDLAEDTPLRMVVLDRPGIDIDLQVMAGGADPAGCVARAHQILELTLPAGTYHLTLDTWVNGSGVAQAGPYTLVVLACEPEDLDCAANPLD